MDTRISAERLDANLERMRSLVENRNLDHDDFARGWYLAVDSMQAWLAEEIAYEAELAQERYIQSIYYGDDE